MAELSGAHLMDMYNIICVRYGSFSQLAGYCGTSLFLNGRQARPQGASTTDDGDSPVEIIISKKYEESMCKTYLPLLVVRRRRQSDTGLRLLRPSYGLATIARDQPRDKTPI